MRSTFENGHGCPMMWRQTSSRLNHLLVLHVHKDRTDDLSCVAVARSFVGDSEHRLSVFGRFR